MKVKLLDFKAQQVEYDIGELDDIYIADISVLSGDEVLNVTYKDGSTKKFDSYPKRLINYFDHRYNVYSPSVNLFEDDDWLSRTSSYG